MFEILQVGGLHSLYIWQKKSSTPPALVMEGTHILQLVEQCKIETKKLLELAVAKPRVHWTHPTFTSFLASVEDILSYSVSWQLCPCCTISPSVSVLRALSRSCPEADNVYTKSYTGSPEGKEHYALLSTPHQLERRVLWLRVAFIERKMAAIVEWLLANPGLYYQKSSVLCHTEYGWIFQALLDGPCSIQYRVRFADCVTPTTPSQLVDRHTLVLSVPIDRNDVTMATDKAWTHVQSMYSSSSSGCVYGKNNVLANPAGLCAPLRGYLTLQLTRGELELKWIPNCLLSDSTHCRTGLWDHVISVNMMHEVSHIHCHKVQGCAAEMILIGYDGIGHAPLLFPYQPALFGFLECLKGCRPLITLLPILTPSQGTTADSWSMVFRLQSSDTPTPPPSPHSSDTPTQPPSPHFRDTPTPQPSPPHSSDTPTPPPPPPHSSDSPVDNHVAMDTTLSVDLKEVQVKVSRHLLMQHFYSWLSHSRRVRQVRKHLSYMVSPTHLPVDDHDVIDGGSPLSVGEWLDFCQLPPSEREVKWAELLPIIYLRGVEPSLRAQVWPLLLGVYPVAATDQEREEVWSDITQSYTELRSECQRSEVNHRAFLFRSCGRDSPSLSTVTPASSCHSDSDSVSGDEEMDTSPQPEDHVTAPSPTLSCGSVQSIEELNERAWQFIGELEAIDKDIPRLDRHHWYFKSGDNLLAVRNIVCAYVWLHLDHGYSQGMCDLLAPILVAVDNEPLAYACFLKVMKRAHPLFPPKEPATNTAMESRLENIRTLLEVLEPAFHRYLSEQPGGEGLDLLYCYRWLLLSFKREFSYDDLFRLWESVWAARLTVTEHFEEFLALALLRQYRSAIMDAQLTPSDILSLFNERADRGGLHFLETLRVAVLTVSKLQEELVG